MEKHWVAAFSEMQQFKKSENLQLPTLITEVGYTPFANTTVYPWAFSGQIFYVGPGALFPQWHSISEFGVNENERVMAVHALQTAMGKAPELNFAGVFFWNAYPRSGDLYSVKADKADVYTQAISSLFQAL